MTTLDPRALERLIQDAYVRGVEWNEENPLDRDYRFKAAADYADKTFSYLPASPQPALAVSVQDPMMILAGIRQFGLAPDGSDLRDLEAAVYALVASPPPSGEVEALPDDLRAPLHGLQADLDWLVARIRKEDDEVCGMLKDSIRSRLSKIEEASYRLSSAPATADGWRTMDSAPKDRRLWLAWNPEDWTYGEGRMVDDGWIACGTFYDAKRSPPYRYGEAKVEPVFWMPLLGGR